MRYVFLPGTLCDERVWLPVWKQLSLSARAYVPLQWANSLEEMDPKLMITFLEKKFT